VKKIYVFIMALILFPCFNVKAEENYFKIMYINSKEGLSKYSKPSINSDITGVLLNGQRIIINTKDSFEDNIDGKIDYWYRIRFDDNGYNDKDYIFGGYLSENLPSELPIFLGRWDNIDDQREYFTFKPNYYYSNGMKETSLGLWGTWKLDENKITINKTFIGYDAEHSAISFYRNLDDAFEIKVIIIDSNNIILKLPQNRTINVKRSIDLWQ